MDLGNPLWFLEPKVPPLRSKVINRNDYNNTTISPAQLPQKQRPAQQQPSPQQLQRQVQSQSQVSAQRPNAVDMSSIGTRRPQTPAVPRFQPIAVAPHTRLNTSPVPLQRPEPICQIKNSANLANTPEQHESVRVPQVSVAQSSLTLGESFNDTDSLSSRDDRNASDSDDGGCDVASVLSKASTKASSSRRSIKSGRCDKREKRRQHQQQRAESRYNRREKRELKCLGRGGSVVRQSGGRSDQECTASETVTSPENSSGNVNDTVAGAGTSTLRICRRRKFNKLTKYLPTLSLGLSTAVILFSDRRSVASVLMAALHATRSIPYLF